MTTAQFLIIATIIIYLGSMLLIGFHFNRKGSGSSSGDFYLGGRHLGDLRTPAGRSRRSDHERGRQPADTRTVCRGPADLRRDFQVLNTESARLLPLNADPNKKKIFRHMRYAQ